MVNLKLNAVPWAAEADDALVMVGVWATVSLKVCVVVPPEFVAVMVIV